MPLPLMRKHPKTAVFAGLSAGVLASVVVDLATGTPVASGVAVFVLLCTAIPLLLAHLIAGAVHRTECPHLNPASQLPPVGCPLIIEVHGRLLRAERTSFVQSRDHELAYRLADGTEITGRFCWTYP